MFNTHNSRPPAYLNIQRITCKALGFLNLNLQCKLDLDPAPPPHYSPGCVDETHCFCCDAAMQGVGRGGGMRGHTIPQAVSPIPLPF